MFIHISVAPRSCPRGFEQVKNDCFYLSDRSVGWIEAKKGCEGRGARLVSLETEEEWELVMQRMEDAGAKFIWTSGHICDRDVGQR